ncbi:lipocalin family protein [Akkermansia muciniphila]|uniref:lipocalin family protein n=1 Tax=Akkermansia muciniphila TaxID=239935 RepID=UPI0033A6A823
MKPSAASLSGCWTQPVPEQPQHIQGMALMPDGRASSINMHTLLYTGWRLDGNRLTLTGKSTGNEIPPSSPRPPPLTVSAKPRSS